MIELILATLNNIIAHILNFVISWWGDEMELSMASLLDKIPYLATGYSIFQAMALAFAIVIAAFSIYSVFLSAGESRTSPVRVLVMTGVSIGMIYFGNYIAMMLIDFIKKPYDAFWDTSIAGGGTSATVQGVLIDVGSLLVGGGPGNFTLLTGVIKTAAVFILTVAITVALFKLYVELFERYLMVGITVYAFAPLAYATIASDQTIHIFKRWFSMLIGQLILMCLSVWSLKLILSGFASMDNLAQCFLVLAACHVAQRLDTYLAQLGLNVVTTGGNLLDEAVGTGAAIAGLAKSATNAWTGGKGNNSKAILGENYGKEGRWGGLGGAWSQFNRARKGGATVSDSMKAAVAGFTTSAAARNQEIKNAAQQREQAERKATQNANGARNAARDRTQRYPAPKDQNEKFTPAFQQMAAEAHRAPAAFAAQNLRNEGSGRFNVTPEGTAGLNETAVRAGLSYNTPNGENPRNMTGGSLKTPMASVTGPDASVKDFIAKNYSLPVTQGAQQANHAMQAVYRDATDSMRETARGSSPSMAAGILAHPSYSLAGNDEVGGELMQKAFGPALVHEEGKFSNVTAVTDGNDNGARHIYAVHTDMNGVERGYEVMDETGYFHADDNMRASMQEIQTEDGARFFAHEVPVDEVREVNQQTITHIASDEHTVSIQDSPENVANYGPIHVNDDDEGDFEPVDSGAADSGPGDSSSADTPDASPNENSGKKSSPIEEEPILGENQREKRERTKKKWDPDRD